MSEQMKKTAGRFLKNRSFTAGCIMILFLFGIMVLSLFWTPFDPIKMIRGQTFLDPGAEHFLGTDNFGRDIFSRLITGAQSAFLVGTFTVLIGGIIGTILGSCAGYFGGWIDEAIMRVIDAQMAFPGVLIALMTKQRPWHRGAALLLKKSFGVTEDNLLEMDIHTMEEVAEASRS